MKIEVLSPHGFCGGVARAIKMAREALAARGCEGNGTATVYCFHEIVHSEQVVQELTAKGMRFVESVDDVPKGAVLLISAHGAPPTVYDTAAARGLRVIDATCPFVTENHQTIRANHEKGMRTVVVGDPDHAEVRGYLGDPGACLPEDVKPNEPVGRIVQTTLDAAAQEGVCTATRDRQQAVRDFVAFSRGASVGVLVVGGAKSANTARLAEIAENCGAKAWRVSSPDEVSRLEFGGLDILGVTSGASTPESLFQAVLLSFRSRSSSASAL